MQTSVDTENLAFLHSSLVMVYTLLLGRRILQSVNGTFKCTKWIFSARVLHHHLSKMPF